MIEIPLWALAPSYASTTQAKSAFAPTKQAPAGGVGVVPVVGTLYKDQLLWVRNQVLAMAADNSIGEILLRIESPGGYLHGVADCYSAIAAAAAAKPVRAFLEDIGASAAYWIASAATECICSRTCVVGSIGVFLAIADTSELLERMGIRVVVIRSGPHKGPLEGAKLTDEQIEQLQQRVDATADVFINDVARGRRLPPEKVRDYATGRVWVGAQAVEAKLCDRVALWDDVIRESMRRTEPFVWNRLTGQAAVEKFEQLVRADWRMGEVSGSKQAQERVRSKYPKLAEAAAAHESDRYIKHIPGHLPY